jgi:hypothetical protein
MGIFYRQRLQWTLQEKCKPCDNSDLDDAEKGDYKPAYKKSPKAAGNQLWDMPPELAGIVAVWPELPVHIKAAIMALVQTAIQGD